MEETNLNNVKPEDELVARISERGGVVWTLVSVRKVSATRVTLDLERAGPGTSQPAASVVFFKSTGLPSGESSVRYSDRMGYIFYKADEESRARAKKDSDWLKHSILVQKVGGWLREEALEKRSDRVLKLIVCLLRGGEHTTFMRAVEALRELQKKDKVEGRMWGIRPRSWVSFPLGRRCVKLSESDDANPNQPLWVYTDHVTMGMTGSAYIPTESELFEEWELFRVEG